MEKGLGKYSTGIGDRFEHQGVFQLSAIQEALKSGVEITPVWNKSYREHQIAGTKPESVRVEADYAVNVNRWQGAYFVDADHITLDTVDDFVGSSDYFTIDVVDQIGQPLSASEKEVFASKFKDHLGDVIIDGIDRPFTVTPESQMEYADTYYKAAVQAKKIYERIRQLKEKENFVVEVSMDEVSSPQRPVELYFILLFLAENKVPVDTIAPKFTGRFNKGVDYQGITEDFVENFELDLLVVRHACKYFGLPEQLKLSVHTGSDKFSLYPEINRLIKKYNCGLHLKTAGTTWLEELIGLAESGGTGLEMAKSIYAEAFDRFEELTAPYKNVLDIDDTNLPSPEEMASWDGKKYANAIRHDQTHPFYNPDLRQLLHTAYKIAAEKGSSFLGELIKNKEIIGKNVKTNILERHIKPLFLN